MFQNIKDYSKSWLIRGTLILVMVAFIGSGLIGTIRTYKMTKPIASVKNTNYNVPLDQFQQYISNKIREIRDKNPELTISDLKKKNFFSETLNQMLNEKLLEAECHKHNIFLPNDYINRTVKSIPFFQKKGIFQPELLNQYLKYLRIPTDNFLHNIEKSLKIEQLISVLSLSVRFPKNYNQELVKLLLKKNDFYIIELDYKRFHPDCCLPRDDEDLKDYYNQKKTNYHLPTKYDISISTLNIPSFIKTIPVTEEEINKFYQDNKESFIKKEKRSIHRIIYPTEKTAQKALQDLQNGGDIKNLFIRIPGGKYKFFKQIEKEKAPQNDSEILFSTKERIIFLKPYTIYIIEDIKKEELQTLEKVKDFILQELQNEQSEDKINKMRNAIEDDLAAGLNIKDIENKYPLNTEKINASKLTDFEKYLNSEQKVLFEEVKKLSKKAPLSSFFELNENDLVFIKLNKKIPAHTPDFESIKEKIKQDFIHEKLKEKAKKRIKNYKQYSKEQIKKEAKTINIRFIDYFSNNTNKIPQYIADKLLSLKKGQSIDYEHDDKMYIVWKKENNQNEKFDSKEEETLEKNFLDQIHKNFQNVCIKVLRECRPYSIDEELLTHYIESL